MAYQWHQEEEHTNHDRQYTSHKPKKGKATSSLFPNEVITMLDRIHDTQQDNKQDKTQKKTRNKQHHAARL